MGAMEALLHFFCYQSWSVDTLISICISAKIPYLEKVRHRHSDFSMAQAVLSLDSKRMFAEIRMQIYDVLL